MRLLWRWPLFSTYVGLTICVALVVTVRVSFGPAPWDIEEATAIYLTILGLPWSAWLSGWWLIAGSQSMRSCCWQEVALLNLSAAPPNKRLKLAARVD